MKRVVIDTNCLVQMLPKRSQYHLAWEAFRKELFELCLSNDILMEYSEILSKLASPIVSENVVLAIMHSPNALLFDPKFKFELITADVDDNKFVDCAIIANATYIVSNYAHFNELKKLPKELQIDVLRLDEFLEDVKRLVK